MVLRRRWSVDPGWREIFVALDTPGRTRGRGFTLCSQRPAVASLQKCTVTPKKRIASPRTIRAVAVLGGCARSDLCANKGPHEARLLAVSPTSRQQNAQQHGPSAALFALCPRHSRPPLLHPSPTATPRRLWPACHHSGMAASPCSHRPRPQPPSRVTRRIGHCAPVAAHRAPVP